MKAVIAAINAKYVHTSLSVRCIAKAAEGICECETAEYTINDSTDGIISDMYEKAADVAAFSCYIWNIETVLRVARSLKLVSPKTQIVLGGYEVMFDSDSVMKNNPFVDYICLGEGEISFANLLRALMGETDISDAGNVVYRSADGKEIIANPSDGRCVDMDSVPIPYDGNIDSVKNKIVYYESSRGCPYRCTYCISGINGGVRFRSAEKVCDDLNFFISRRIPLVKFVDRTFNANPKRAYRIFEYIINTRADTRFHMELAGDILDDATIELLKTAPEGLFQFEIGVQTTNHDTMDAIRRKISFSKLRQNTQRLIEAGNIHIHLDLIAGLPYEDMESFKKSFNDVISIRPHVLQLGFLKMLKGSEILAQSGKHGYVYRPYPPYEVLENKYISYGELLELKRVECALDRYYNSGTFAKTMDYLFEIYNDRYRLFYDISEYFEKNFAQNIAFSKQALFDALYGCFLNADMSDEFIQALKFDYLHAFRAAKRPQWFGEYDSSALDAAYEFFKDENIKAEFFPKYSNVPAKEIMKHIHAEGFPQGILLFDYKENMVYNISDYI